MRNGARIQVVAAATTFMVLFAPLQATAFTLCSPLAPCPSPDIAPSFQPAPANQPFAPQGTSEYRRLVHGTTSQCLQSSITSPAFESIPRERTALFCKCYATAMVDVLTSPEVVAQAEGQMLDITKEKAQTAIALCLKQAHLHVVR